MKSKLTKKYNVPGLMSALVIPLLFWFYGNRELQKPIANVMDLGLPAKYNPKLPLNQQFSFENFRNWEYKKSKLFLMQKKVQNSMFQKLKIFKNETKKILELNLFLMIKILTTILYPF